MNLDQPIVIATGNPHKIDEIRAVLSPIGVDVVGLSDLPGPFEEPAEGKDSFIENATLKAVSYARQTGRVCLADDSGLEVDALGGAPGVISSHYATDGEETGASREERDRANNQRLLRELKGVAPEQRSARFVCTMVLAAPPPTLGGGGFQPPQLTTSATKYDGRFTQRRGGKLPHWDLGGGTYFITISARRGVAFTAPERQIILNACTHWHGKSVLIHAACVMPDHVHLLLRTLELPDGSYTPVADVMHSIKSYSANQINNHRAVSGSIWQREYYDRLVRNTEEAEEALRYIEMNAVHAGLADQPHAYPYLWEAGRETGGLEAPPSKSVVLAVVRGTFEGRIGQPGEVPRGSNGFGYDPLVLVAPEFSRTCAELTPQEKNARSHRGEAARLMAQEIRRLAGRD